MPQPAPGHVVTCNKPSISSRSMNAPKSVDVFHRAGLRGHHIHAFHEFQTFFASLLSITARRLSTTFLRSSLSLTILKSTCCQQIAAIFGGRHRFAMPAKMPRLRCSPSGRLSLPIFTLPLMSRTFEHTDDLVPILAVSGFLLREKQPCLSRFPAAPEARPPRRQPERSERTHSGQE